MADDNNQRPYRPNDARSAPQGTSAAANDPLAELARLIGQSDPFAEFGRDAARRAAPPRPADAPADWPAPPANPAHAQAPAAPAPSTQPDMPQAQPYGAPNYEPQRYNTAPYAGGAGLYRTEVDAAYAGAAAPSGGYASDPIIRTSSMRLRTRISTMTPRRRAGAWGSSPSPRSLRWP